jgi:hypothetical protein
MKSFYILSALALVGTCATPKYTTRIQTIKDNIHLADSTLIVNYANTITSEELCAHLYTFSSGDFEGRKVGEKGQKEAVNFLKSYYQNEGINSPYGDYYNICTFGSSWY